MRFTETPLSGLYVVEPEPIGDERGLFARTCCAREFGAQGLVSRFVQCSTSFNRWRGTLRGLHFQAEPKPETKLVRCTAGAMFDVAVDLRPGAATRGQWFGVTLTAENRRALYLPAGMAHGFQTLADNTEVFYQISEFYHAELTRGVRWNDPALAIAWPLPEQPILSERDGLLPWLAELSC